MGGEFSPYGVAATVVALLLMSASMAAFAQRGATFTPASLGDGEDSLRLGLRRALFSK